MYIIMRLNSTLNVKLNQLKWKLLHIFMTRTKQVLNRNIKFRISYTYIILYVLHKYKNKEIKYIIIIVI